METARLNELVFDLFYCSRAHRLVYTESLIYTHFYPALCQSQISIKVYF